MSILDILPWKSKATSADVGSINIPSAKYVSPSVKTRDLLSRYHQWVYTCASKNANSVAQSKLRLYAVTRDGDRRVRAPHKSVDMRTVRRKSVMDHGNVVEITSHPFLDLLKNINDIDDHYETMELSELYLELSGNCYWYVNYNDMGIPDAIMVLRPDKVKIVPSETGGIQGYLYGVGAKKIALQKHEILHFKMPNPCNEYYGMGPLQAIIASDEQYQRTLEYETALAQNSAIPALGIMYDGHIQGDEARKIEANWNRTLRGQAKTGKAKVFDSRFEIKQFQLSPAELNYLEGRKWTREEIAGAFGVPLSLLTTGNVNMANAIVGERTYAKWTIVPRLSRIEDRINAVLSEWYGEDRIFVAYDNVVPEDTEYELKRTIELAGAGIVTRDEARMMQGLDPVGGDEGASYIPATDHNQDDEKLYTSGKSFSQKSRQNEHEFILRSQSNFETFRRVNDDFDRGIHVIYGITSDDRTHIFAILFDATIWTFAASKKWIRDHNYEPLERLPAQDPLSKSEVRI